MGGILKTVGVVFGLLILVGMIFGGSDRQSGTSNSRNSDSDATRSHARELAEFNRLEREARGITVDDSGKISISKAFAYTPKLEVQSWRCTKEYTYIFVEGLVKNLTAESLKNVMVVGIFKTSSGDFVKSADAIIAYNPILPGQTSPFKAGTTDNPEIKSCYIEFKHLMGGTISSTSKKSRSSEHRVKIREVQRLLNALGYNAGSADGILGPTTASAIKAFQRDKGYPADGEVSHFLLSLLRTAQ